MIIQQTKIIKHTTEDGMYTIRDGDTMIGKELWVIPSKVAMLRTANPDKKASVLRVMIALAESPTDGIPVELLEFSNVFKAISDL